VNVRFRFYLLAAFTGLTFRNISCEFRMLWTLLAAPVARGSAIPEGLMDSLPLVWRYLLHDDPDVLIPRNRALILRITMCWRCIRLTSREVVECGLRAYAGFSGFLFWFSSLSPFGYLRLRAVQFDGCEVC
jgi:hypothetical protein